MRLTRCPLCPDSVTGKSPFALDCGWEDSNLQPNDYQPLELNHRDTGSLAEISRRLGSPLPVYQKTRQASEIVMLIFRALRFSRFAMLSAFGSCYCKSMG